MQTLMQDLRYAARSLRRSPGFTLVAVSCMALGIGAVSTVFGVVDTIFFRAPEGIGDPGAIVQPYITRRTGAVGQVATNSTSYPEYVDLRDNARSLSGLAAFAPGGVLSIGRGASVDRATGILVSRNYFAVLQVKPALGRFFTTEEDAGPGSPPAAVISHEYWQRHYVGDAGVVGKTVTINGVQFPIVGVTPTGFRGIDLDEPDIWIPLSQMTRVTSIEPEIFTNRISTWVRMVGRLAPGVTSDRAESELEAILLHLAQAEPRLDPHPELVLGPIFSARGPAPSEQAIIARWLALAAIMVLAIACANTANLLLARAAGRRREIAIRLSAGATRWRIARQLLTESVLLASLGAGVGLVLALWSAGLVPAIGLPQLDFFAQGRVLLLASGAAVLCGLLFGLAPVLAATRTELAMVMKEGAPGGVDRRSRIRAVLMIAQLALATLLLAGAGLFVHSLRNVMTIDAGFDVDHLLDASLDLRSVGYSETRVATFYDRALERVRALPGVTGATLVQTLPLSGMWSAMNYTIPGGARHPSDDAGASGVGLMDDAMPATYNVGARYFGTIGTPIIQGRDFTEQDRAAGARSVIVNEAFARREWADASPLGRCIDIAESCFTVVGVVANSKYANLMEPERPAFFLALGKSAHRSLLIRTAGDPSAAIPNVRSALQSLDDDLPYANLRTLNDVLRPRLQPYRLGAAMFGLFGFLALVLAAVGLYGVVAYSVAQRTREVGIRIALGAQGRDVLRPVIRHGAMLALAGLVTGVVAALTGARFITHMLYGVSAADPLTFAGVCFLLAAVAILASWIPARRAVRVDPMVALRSE